METTKRVELLQNLIQIPSVNDNETLVADYLAAQFAPYEAAKVTRVTYAPGRDNLVITIGDQKVPQQLGLSGHLDVVAAGDETAWRHPPFAAVIENGRLYGRGASDMKSGLAAIVVALLERLESNRLPAGGLRLLATVGEETGEYGAAQLTDAGYVNGLTGMVIAEPTGLNQVAFAAKGVIDYTVQATGKAAHSSSPERGNNAIDQLFAFYGEVQALMAGYQAKDAVLGGLTHSVDLIEGGEQINSVPEKASLSANIRTIPAHPNAVVMADLDRLVARLNERQGFHLQLTYHYPEEVMTGRKDAPLITQIQKIGHRVTGQKIEAVGASGANDGSEFRRAGQFPIAVFGPGSGTSHAVDEYLDLKQYELAIEIYDQLIESFFE